MPPLPLQVPLVCNYSGISDRKKMIQNPVCVKDFEKHALSVLPRFASDYYKSGAGEEVTLEQNRKAFSRLKIRPRCLRNVANRDLSTTVLGQKVDIPIGIAPTALQKMAHPDGESANARAAQGMGAIFTLSTISTTSIEEVARAAPHGTKWFQLYIYKDREATKSLVQRAEIAGFKALVLTVDSPMFGIRRRDVRNNFAVPPHLKLANFQDEKATLANSTVEGSSFDHYVKTLFDAGLEWKDVAWLKTITKLPLVLKGILTAEDAIIAADVGVDGILVSNHGARQLDGSPATIEALPEIVRAVGHRLEVYMDGGVTDGVDVFKALALGARMVFIGRAAVYGLVHSGEEGVRKVLTILKTEFEYALAISGCSSIKDITPSMVVPEGYYHRL